MKQRTLAMMTGFERYTKKTRRAQFLEEMEQVVPRRKLCALIEPQYPQAGKGRPPVPDESTVCKFRHLLEGPGMGGEMLETVKLRLQSQGVRSTTGSIVNA